MYEVRLRLPNLFIGPNPRDQADFEQLQAMKITAILSLQSENDVKRSEFLSRRRAASQRASTSITFRWSILTVRTCDESFEVVLGPSMIY